MFSIFNVSLRFDNCSEPYNSILWPVSGPEYQHLQMNCFKQNKINILEIQILKKGKKQDIPF